MDDPIYAITGIKLTHILGGLSGGSVHALLTRGDGWQKVTSMCVGLLTAAHMTPMNYQIALKWTPVPVSPSSEHAISFLTGVTAMFICRGVMSWARNWSRKPGLPE